MISKMVEILPGILVDKMFRIVIRHHSPKHFSEHIQIVVVDVVNQSQSFHQLI